MLNVLLFAIEWILMSSLGLFPSTLAKGISEYMVYPLASSVATTKATPIARPQNKRVILASRSVKSLVTDSIHQPTIFASSTDNDPDSSFVVTSAGHEDFPFPLHHEHNEYDDSSTSSHEYDRSENFSQQLDEHESYHLPQHLNTELGTCEHPVQYRFFGKSRSRLRNRDSIPFILLGPSVDHWSIVGQNLASRGFSVMAVSLDEVEDDRSRSSGGGPSIEAHEKMVEAVLEALRWNRSILVGCDGAAILAIKAALQLAPEGRVAGLLLCGDLSEVRRQTGNVERFLEQNLECPYSVIWDGDNSAMPSADDAVVNSHRCLIRGGGLAPHRRLPEQFAWALTRFVEEQVAPLRKGVLDTTSSPRRFRMPESKLITPGGLLVAGRVLASVVFYVSAAKVIMFQYENIYDCVLKINSGYKSMAVWPQRILRFLGEAAIGWKGLTLSTKQGFESSLEGPQIITDEQDQEDEEKVFEKEFELEGREPSLDIVPPIPMTLNDDIRWPIPLINPVSV